MHVTTDGDDDNHSRQGHTSCGLLAAKVLLGRGVLRFVPYMVTSLDSCGE